MLKNTEGSKNTEAIICFQPIFFIYTLWGRKCFLPPVPHFRTNPLPVTYFPTNLVYPFSLRVTGIKRCAVPQLSEETLNFSLHHENFQKSRSFLLHDQSDDLISQLSIFENFLSHNQGSLGYKDYIYALRSRYLLIILQLLCFYTRYS